MAAFPSRAYRFLHCFYPLRTEKTQDYIVPEKEEGLLAALRSLVLRKFRKVRAVDGVSLSIEEGELVGFLGANGAGKTTTLKMLSGLLTPTEGSAEVLGHVPWRRDPEFQKRISLVMGQRSQLWWELPAQETFLLNKVIYGMSEAEYKANLEELSELLQIGPLLSVPVKKLSLGQRMRAELALALLHHPRLLLLDEPTLGLDVVMQKKVREFIRAYNRKHRATILLTSHNMDDVVELCPRVLIIELGKILYDGSLEQLISRYAENKFISVIFEREIALGPLANIGRVVANGGLRAVLEVPRREVSRRAAELLGSFPVADLTIEEVSIDEIVRRIFTQAGGGHGD
ncbi:MAG: ATP-binding cassette domain-containing protein [Elusimicrobia bacterium]|nr:ATP-binding cassette domain-containing protein [Elusimicrobiota bacterium]